jgi:hypothetical protein
MCHTPLRTPSAPGLRVLACRFKIHSPEKSGFSRFDTDMAGVETDYRASDGGDGCSKLSTSEKNLNTRVSSRSRILLL